MNYKAYCYEIWYVTSLSKGLQSLYMSLTLTFVQGHSDILLKFALNSFSHEQKGLMLRNLIFSILKQRATNFWQAIDLDLVSRSIWPDLENLLDYLFSLNDRSVITKFDKQHPWAKGYKVWAYYWPWPLFKVTATFHRNFLWRAFSPELEGLLLPNFIYSLPEHRATMLVHVIDPDLGSRSLWHFIENFLWTAYSHEQKGLWLPNLIYTILKQRATKSAQVNDLDLVSRSIWQD